MPFGAIPVYADLVDDLMKVRPQSILDLGIGYGINGAGVRNWIQGNRFLVGVEGFGSYRSALWNCYDRVVVDTIQNFLSTTSYNFDYIIMTDVLEHFTKAEGHIVIQQMKEHLFPGGTIFISTPAIWIDQGAADGNDLQIHRSLWCVEDFEGFEILQDGTPDKYGCQMIAAKYKSMK